MAARHRATPNEAKLDAIQKMLAGKLSSESKHREYTRKYIHELDRRLKSIEVYLSDIKRHGKTIDAKLDRYPARREPAYEIYHDDRFGRFGS